MLQTSACIFLLYFIMIIEGLPNYFAPNSTNVLVHVKKNTRCFFIVTINGMLQHVCNVYTCFVGYRTGGRIVDSGKYNGHTSRVWRDLRLANLLTNALVEFSDLWENTVFFRITEFEKQIVIIIYYHYYYCQNNCNCQNDCNEIYRCRFLITTITNTMSRSVHDGKR